MKKKLGYKIPKNYIEFLEKNDIKALSQKEFPITHNDGYKTSGIIENFFPLETFLESNKYSDEAFKDLAEHFELGKNYVEPEYLYAIASCPSGAVCMALNGKHEGKIYNADNGDFGIVLLNSNLDDFISSLYSSENFKCTYENLLDAIKNNDLDKFIDLFENKDGEKLVTLSSWLDIEIYDLAKTNSQNEILKFYTSKGFNGFKRHKSSIFQKIRSKVSGIWNKKDYR